MEHFPAILDMVDPIEVPYLGGTYKGGDFSAYAASQGYDLVAMQRGKFGSSTKETVAQMLQAWLYFGLLHEVLQLDIHEPDFVREASDGQAKFITTAKLKGYLRRWRAVHESTKSEQNLLLQRKEHTILALKTSYSAWSGFDDFSAIVGPLVNLSIHLLATALEHAVTSVSAASTPQGNNNFEPWISISNAPWRKTPSPFVEERMRRLGWCPTVIAQLGRPAKLGLLTFVSLLKPSFPKIQGAHADCQFGGIGCKEKHIDNKLYATKHLDDCDCVDRDPKTGPKAFLAVDEQELRRILEKGGIPIVHLLDDQQTGLPRLQVLEYRHELQYTAISHVWADGLGNPSRNALPLCQLKRIVYHLTKAHWTPVAKKPPTAYVDSVWDTSEAPTGPAFTAEELNAAPKYFWIDSLCLPPSPEALRKSAMKSMRAVYNRANRVLVLDTDLLRTRGTIDTLSAQEILARISASSWVRRYWTLQEGLLAKNLYFQFAESAFKIIEDPEQHENIISFHFDDEVGYYADDTDFRMRSRASRISYGARVGSVWSALAGRSLSYTVDEAFCVATLLDMNLDELLSDQVHDRVEKLWEMYRAFPLGVLCMPARKLHDSQRPWALARLKDCSSRVPPMSVYATQENDVLRFRHHGLILSKPLLRSPKGLITVEIGRQEVYYIRQNVKNENESWDGIDFASQASRLALVLGQDYEGEFDACLAALVSIENVGEKELLAGSTRLRGRYLRAVSVMRKGSIFDEAPNPAWSVEEKAEKENVHEASWTITGQEWEVSA